MSRAQRKDERKSLIDAQDRERALSVDRDVDDDVHYRGAGTALLRLAHLPSFLPPSVWEIRELGEQLTAYRAVGTEPGSRRVTGHQLVSVPQDALAATLGALRGMTVPLRIAAPTCGVADGDQYVATFCAGFVTTLQVALCDGYHPAEWARVVEELIHFRAFFDAEPV